MCYQNSIFPTSEVLFTSMSHSSALLLERIGIVEDARFPGKILLKSKSFDFAVYKPYKMLEMVIAPLCA